jgi:hypothetical protein
MRKTFFYNSRKRRREKVLRKCAAARATRARKRQERPIPERPPQRLSEGEFLGTLQWQDMSGKVNRWTVRQGKRVDQIHVDGMREDHGWDYVLAKLRTKLSKKKLITV